MVNEEEYKKQIEGIELFMKQSEQELLPIKNVINWIVTNSIYNPDSIKKTLDTLLKFIFKGLGNEEYHTLNNFYAKFSPKNAKEYKQLYKKMCGKEY